MTTQVRNLRQLRKEIEKRRDQYLKASLSFRQKKKEVLCSASMVLAYNSCLELLKKLEEHEKAEGIRRFDTETELLDGAKRGNPIILPSRNNRNRVGPIRKQPITLVPVDDNMDLLRRWKGEG